MEIIIESSLNQHGIYNCNDDCIDCDGDTSKNNDDCTCYGHCHCLSD